jgi:ribosomal protein S18 acetylase RimI-like enzyme
MTTTPNLRRARADDAPALADLAARTFQDAFAEENSPEDMATHLARAYGSAQQAAEIATPGLHTWVAEDATGALVAFTQVLLDAANPDAGGVHPAQVRRFYVERAWHGGGLAQRLMAAVLEDARAHGADLLWLGVWEHNPRAHAFYRRFGFHDVGEQVFLLGNDPQRDIVLARALARSSNLP